MAAVRHVGFSKTWLLISVSHGLRQLIYFPSLYQIWWKIFERRPNYGPKTKFKMAAATILNLLPVAIFNTLSTFHYWSQPSYKISWKYLNSIHEWIIITFAIQDGSRPSCWIFENLIIDRCSSLHCWFSVTIAYQIWCKNCDRCPKYGSKLKFKMAALREYHVGYQNHKNRTVLTELFKNEKEKRK